MDLAVAAAGADHVPESRLVLSRRFRAGILILRRALLRIGMDRIGRRSRQAGVNLRLLFQPLDLRAQVFYFLRHFVVLLHCVGGYQPVLPAVLLQERLGLLPEGVSFVSQFQNLTHSLYLHKVFLWNIVKENITKWVILLIFLKVSTDRINRVIAA